ncbi:MAG TPA: hypothetical protein PKD05_14525 [Candidatus Melainabacteria bacterium]|nr:hypothetical protein [Candidatus Melainabacteria bacterium]HMP52766.1 hypothetical protein [Candidatus Melainabacteria bacterium]
MRGFYSVCIVLLSFCFPKAGVAALGDSIKAFQSKNRERLELKEILIRDEKKYYSFNILVDENELQMAPGFKVGMTVTVSSGKICGQSLAISCGSNPMEGNRLAVDQCYRFACESLGREASNGAAELSLVQQAVLLAFSNMPQVLKFPDTSGKIVFKTEKKGEEKILLVAALKN